MMRRSEGMYHEGMRRDSFERFVGFINVAFARIEMCCFGISVFALSMMMFLVAFDVMMRYGLGNPIPGAQEVTEDYLMVALVFLALSYTFKKGQFVRVTAFLKYIPNCAKKPINVILNLGGLLFMFCLAYSGGKTFIRAMRLGEFSVSVLRYPLAPAYFLAFLGCALLLIRLFISSFRNYEFESTDQQV